MSRLLPAVNLSAESNRPSRLQSEWYITFNYSFVRENNMDTKRNNTMSVW